MIRKGVRYEDCNGRAGGNKKAAARGKFLRQEKTIIRNDKKKER